MIRHFLVGTTMLLGLSLPLIWTACDRTVEEKSKVTTDNGETKVEKKTIVEHPDGTVSEEKQKSVTQDR